MKNAKHSLLWLFWAKNSVLLWVLWTSCWENQSTALFLLRNAGNPSPLRWQRWEGTCVCDSVAESLNVGMSGFWANDWLGKFEGQTLQVFSYDLLQVMSVAVTLLVDMRVHWCLSLIFCISNSASLSNHIISMQLQSMGLVSWQGLCTMYKNNDLKIKPNKDQVRIHAPLQSLLV